MNLSWNEIRLRAKAFAREWSKAHYEKGETQSFYNDFFQIFGVTRRMVATYEHAVAKMGGGTGFIDLFWPGQIIVEQKSAGRDLFRARTQAEDYLHKLPAQEVPKLVLACDFQTFLLTDLDTREETAFTLADLHKHVEKFAFILGRQTVRFKDQDPVNIKAAELVGALHDALEASGYTGHKLEVFLTRIVFCLFADDTGIFEPRDILWSWLDGISRPDDVGPRIGRLFEVLNTPEAERQTTLPEDLARFPYINGHLFETQFPSPDFNEDMRAALLNACRFDWTPISPAIFGSLFQSVMDKAERRKKGAHYTTEKNILKVIRPLFLDDLRAEFDAIRTRRTGRDRALTAFHDKLASLTFFDPACGCGNFLIIAYRELRLLEIEVLKALRGDGQQVFEADTLSRIDVDQFYGIELEEFPARIAETALWMMDHLMNLRLSEAFGGYFPRIPLKKAPHIVHGDALEIDWADVLPPERCSYVFGNPPFVGAKFQSQGQREQVRRIAALGKSGGTLDFVAAWFIKAGDYARRSSLPSPRGGEGQGGGLPVLAPRIAFVATNSITQGEQVAQLWPVLFDRHALEIAFAHRTFAWGSDARGKAHVHVVILGLDRREVARDQRRLFSYPDINGDPVESVHRAISPYLFDAGGLGDAHLVVREAPEPLNGMHPLGIGSKPIDDGKFIFSDDREMQAFVAIEPGSAKFIRPFWGAHDYINGERRWILALHDASPRDLRELPKVRERIRQVREFRLSSKSAPTVALAATPTVYHVNVLPKLPFVLIPRHSSERREVVPFGYLEPPAIAGDSALVLLDAPLTLFAMLTSAMHMAWMKAICGRLESRYRYSAGLVYNTFPLPPGADGGKSPALKPLEPLAQAVLDARAAHPDATLADLYDPDTMPPNLRAAHTALDRAVDRLYRREPFGSDRERVEHLFGLYEKMVAPLLAVPKAKRGRKKVATPPRPTPG
jgi:hypothetical protein